MDVAIVTGAASGVGLAISRQLVDLGFRVYGLGGNYKDIPYTHDYFIPMPCDLTSVEDIGDKVKQVLEKEDSIYVVVNNAKFYPRSNFADCRLFELEASVRINLLAPMVLTRMALPSLKSLQGFVINIAANSPEDTRGGIAGAASSGGLHWMGEALFEEMREFGVKVCTIYPKTNRYRPENAGNPGKGAASQASIDPDAVGEAVRKIVTHRDGNVVTEIVIRPQRVKETGLPGVIELPYPKADKDALYREVEDIKERSKAEEIRRVEDRKKHEVERKEREAKVAEEARRKEERRMEEARRKAEEKKRRDEAFRKQEQAVRDAEQQMLEKERERKEARRKPTKDELPPHDEDAPIDVAEEQEVADTSPISRNGEAGDENDQTSRSKSRRRRNRGRGRRDREETQPESNGVAPAEDLQSQEDSDKDTPKRLETTGAQEVVDSAAEDVPAKPRRNRRNRVRVTPSSVLPAIAQDYLSKYTPRAVSDRRKKSTSSSASPKEAGSTEPNISPSPTVERQENQPPRPEVSPVPVSKERKAEPKRAQPPAQAKVPVKEKPAKEAPATVKAEPSSKKEEAEPVRKTPTKKVAAKKTVVKKAAVKKSAVKKTATKKTATAPKEAVAKKAVKKTATKKTATKKTAVKKAPASEE